MTIKKKIVTTFENVTDAAHALGTHDDPIEKEKNEHVM